MGFVKVHTSVPQRPSSRQIDPWSRLVLSEVIHGLRQQAKNKSKLKLTDAQKAAVAEIQGKPRAFGVVVTRAKKFVQRSGLSLVKLMMAYGGSGHQTDGEKEMLAWAVKVEKAVAGEEYALKFYLPDFSEDKAKRWPGPIGYRVALNHLVAVATRVHSIFPSAAFDHVIGLVAKVVMVPILAHNLTFLSRDNPKVFMALVGDRKKAGDGRPNVGSLSVLSQGGEPSTPDSLTGEDRQLHDAWSRLLNICIDFHPDKRAARRCALEVIELLNEYGDNPVSSRLWAMLSVIASGDLAVDELLVTKVINADDGRLGTPASQPLVNCARSRFGLLRYSYGMEDQRKLFETNFAEAIKTVNGLPDEIRSMQRPEHLDTKKANEIFGWAYMLSRKTLLGRYNNQAADWPFFEDKKPAAQVFAAQYDAGKALDRLLSALSDEKFINARNAEVSSYAMLALRYLAGYRSNPRFIMDTNESDVAGVIEPIKSRLSAISAMPKGISAMVAARNSLHQAYRKIHHQSVGAEVQLDHAISQYAITLDAILVSNVRFADQERSPNASGVMDGEVAAWCLPEIVTALSLREQFTETSEGKKNLRRMRSALRVLGESQFGVFFNEDEERDRIERGLKIRCRRKFSER
jgi:hypothetical protein